MNTTPSSRTAHGILSTILFTFLLGILGTATHGETTEREAERSKGMKCLFAGHSFFCPVAMSFDRIARKSDFPEHEIRVVFRGGQSGTAGAMWVSPGTRKAVTEVLETGEIELFGLTPGLTDTAETFQRWFDLALEHNPDTRFFVGIPWAIGGHGMDTARFDRTIDGYAAMGGRVVEELRERYPDNRIDYIAYGKIAPAMKRRFEAGTLTDIKRMVGGGSDALFSDDRLGHAGPMLLELCALTWLDLLYDAKLDSLALGDRESDVAGIVEEVMTYNAPFRPGSRDETGTMEKADGDARPDRDQEPDVPATAPDRPQRS